MNMIEKTYECYAIFVRGVTDKGVRKSTKIMEDGDEALDSFIKSYPRFKGEGEIVSMLIKVDDYGIYKVFSYNWNSQRRIEKTFTSTKELKALTKDNRNEIID